MNKSNVIITLLLPLILFACGESTKETETEATTTTDTLDLKTRAQQLAHNNIITDGHVDLPFRMKIHQYRLKKEWIDVSKRTEEGDFDFVRAKQGGLDAPFMSIYIPASYQEKGGAKVFADSLINMVEKITTEYPDKFALAGSPKEVENNFEKGIISLPMGMENGAPIEDDINNVAYFHERGIRYITLTHSKWNQICDSSYDPERKWNGLSPFGVEVVAEMNNVGIMVDISHVSDSTFYQVMQLSKAPVIASHSSCRKYTPDFERNMSDDMIELLGKKGGVIQINFGSGFLDAEVKEFNKINREALTNLLEDQGLSYSDSAAKPIIEQFKNETPTLFADVKTVADHIDHVVALAGIDHVGLGSDYDGVGDSLPTGLKDVSMYPNLIEELLSRGYSDADIKKICYQNVWRVWNRVIEVAEKG